jgi:hypothetical protein
VKRRQQWLSVSAGGLFLIVVCCEPLASHFVYKVVYQLLSVGKNGRSECRVFALQRRGGRSRRVQGSFLLDRWKVAILLVTQSHMAYILRSAILLVTRTRTRAASKNTTDVSPHTSTWFVFVRHKGCTFHQFVVRLVQHSEIKTDSLRVFRVYVCWRSTLEDRPS